VLKVTNVCLFALLVLCVESVATAQLRAHPRLFFTASELHALRAKAKDDSKGEMGFSAAQIWQGVLRSAEASARNPIPPQPYATKPGTRYPWTTICFKVRDNLTPLAVAAAIVEDVQQRRLKVALKRSLFNLCRWNSWGDVSSVSYITAAASLGYDVLYNDLTDAERARIRSALVNKGLKRLYQNSLKIDKRLAFYNNAWGWEHKGLGLGSLALLGEHPDAEKWLEQAKSAFRYMLNVVGDDGGWNEGYNYGVTSLRPLLTFADALKRVTGEDWFNHPFLRNLYTFPLYGLSPDGTGMVNFCDSYYFCHWCVEMAKLASEYRNPYAQWYLKRVYESPNVNEKRDILHTGAEGIALAFIWYDPTLKPKRPDDLPQSRLFKSIGWAMLRSGWGDDDFLLAFKSGFQIWTHTHQDQNHFVLHAYREWLVTDQDYASRTNRTILQYQWNGVGHNVIGYNGKTDFQFEGGMTDKPKYRGYIKEFFTSRIYDYVVGDATEVYRRWKTDEPIFKLNLRHVVFVKPFYVVMLDELRPNDLKNPDGSRYLKSFEYRLHVRGEIKVDGDIVTLMPNDRYKPPRAILKVKFLAPAEAKYKVKRWEGCDWLGPYLEVSAPVRYPLTCFLTALFPMRRGTEERLPQMRKLLGKGFIGAQIKRGDLTDMVAFKFQSEGKTLTFGDLSTDATQVLVTVNGEGKAVRFGMHKGTSLSLEGMTLISSSAKVSCAFEAKDGELWGELEAGEPHRLGIALQQPHTVLVDGRAIDFKFDDEAGQVLLRLGSGHHVIRCFVSRGGE